MNKHSGDLLWSRARYSVSPLFCYDSRRLALISCCICFQFKLLSQIGKSTRLLTTIHASIVTKRVRICKFEQFYLPWMLPSITFFSLLSDFGKCFVCSCWILKEFSSSILFVRESVYFKSVDEGCVLLFVLHAVSINIGPRKDYHLSLTCRCSVSSRPN